MFRWDKWFEGLGVSIALAVIAVLPTVITDGITKAELWSLVVVAVGGLALYCKIHPPEVWDGVDRRNNK